MPFAQLMAVLPLRDVACSLRVPSNPNGLKCNKDENETVIAHRSDCGLFLFRQKKGVRQWMSNSKLIELSYYDPSAQVRLSAYADTLVLDHDQNGSIISAIRFGGYPEMVRAMADAIYGGATIEAAQNDTTRMLQSSLKSYQRQITHDGIYAVATLMAADTVQEDDRSGKHEKDEDTNLVDTEQMELQPRRCYIFCPARDQKRLFEELDHKTAAPLIPEFQDYVLSSLRQRGDLRQLEVISLKERIDAWVLDLKPQDQNVVEVLERGLQSGDIQIPGAVPNMPDGFENVENVTGYLNTFGVTVADRIRSQFMPLFDPAKEPLSDEVLAINDCIMSRVGYSLYDAQLAVAEAVKRQLARKRVAFIIAECGSGKTKIGSTALGALHGLWADQKRKDGRKSFGIVMCPSHVTQKWVREIGETLPDTYGMVVRTIQDLNRLYAMYEKGDKSVFAVFSKEQARDGYWRTGATAAAASGPQYQRKETTMKNNYSIAQRNAIVEDHLWCIDSIIQKNRPLMRAARLEYDDVYQQLAIRLIKAVAGYDPDKGNLQQHIFAQLKYELLNCKAAFRLCGMTGAPRGFQKSDIISLDIVSENSELHEQLLAA